MINKKRLVVLGTFLVALFFMTMYAGSPEETTEIAMRNVKFIDSFNSAEISLQNVELGKEATVPDIPSHNGLLFLGWFNGEERVIDFKNITNDLTVTAKYAKDTNNNLIADSDETPYSVTFYDTLSSSNIRVVQVLAGLSAAAPTVPVHEGYIFTGWSRSFNNITSNITVRAVYRPVNNLNVTEPEIVEPNIILYKVKFINGLTNELIFSTSVEKGLTANTPAVPKMYKKVFSHWEGSYSNVSKDITIKAIYQDDINENNISDEIETRYTVNFVTTDNGTLEGQTEFKDLLINLDFYDNITAPKVNVDQGYSFIGWEPILPEEGTRLSGNKEYKAIIKDITAPNVELTYVSNDGKKENHVNIGKRVAIRFRTNEEIDLNSSLVIIANKKATLTRNKNLSNVYEYVAEINVTNDTTEGIVTFVLNIIDLSGNGADEIITTTAKHSKNGVVVIDYTKPDIPTITAKNGYIAGIYTNQDVILNFYSNDNLTTSENLRYEYNTSPINHPNSWSQVDNPRIFDKDIYNNAYVRAIDEAGNISEYSKYFQVKVDKTKPNTPIIKNSSDNKPTNKDIEINWLATDVKVGTAISEISHYEYSFDKINWDKTNDTKMMFNENIDKELFIRAVDNASNKSEISSTSVVIDKDIIKVTKMLNNSKETPVKDSFQNGRPRITVNAKLGLKSLKYTWTTSNIMPEKNHINVEAKFETKDNINFVNYPQNITDFVKAPNGIYYLWYVAEDTAGNITTYRAGSYLFDNTKPDTPIISSKNEYRSGTWVNKDVILDFKTTDDNTLSENIKYEYNTSPVSHPNAWKEISNPVTFSENTNNNIYVRAIDEAGNISEYSKFFQVKVDKTIPKTPEVETNGYISGIKTNSDVRLNAFGSEEKNNNGQQIAKESPIKYQFRYNDDGNWLDYDTVWFSPNNGSYDTNITFRAIDEAGNSSELSKVTHIIIDNRVPSVPVINSNGYNEGTLTNEQINLTFTSEDNMTSSEKIKYEFKYNNEERVQPITNLTFVHSWKGTVSIRAIDEAGNQSEWTKPFEINIDKTVPQISNIKALNYHYYFENGSHLSSGYYDNKPIKIEVNAQDNTKGKLFYQYGNSNEWTTDNTFTRDITAEKFKVKVKDEAGNITEETIGIHITKGPMFAEFYNNGEIFNEQLLAENNPSVTVKMKDGTTLLEYAYYITTENNLLSKEEIKQNGTFYERSNGHINPSSIKINSIKKDLNQYIIIYAKDFAGNEIHKISPLILWKDQQLVDPDYADSLEIIGGVWDKTAPAYGSRKTFRLTNNTERNVTKWEIKMTLPEGMYVESASGCQYQLSDNQITITSASWNKQILAGKTLDSNPEVQFVNPNDNDFNFTNIKVQYYFD